MAPAGFRLDGGGESLVFLTTARGAPMLVYWGPALAGENAVEDLVALSRRAIPGGSLDGGEVLSWLPEAGQGFTGCPAILAHRQGFELITRLAIDEVAATSSKARIALSDAGAQISVTLELTLDAATGVLESRARLLNCGDTPLTLDWLAAGVLASPHAELMLFDGRWAREFIPVRQRLVTGLMMKENRTGRTSHHAPPFMIAGEAGFGETRGEVFAAHLAWSGDHRLFAERLRDGRMQLQAGELFHPGEMVLAPGESYRTPSLYLARSDHGLNGLSDRMHRFVRGRVLGGRLVGKPRPVHFNTWEAVYFDHDVETLKTLADLAAGVGAERFVLDDGWFKGRADDRAGLGDWTVDAGKYPAGLSPLIEHVRAKGMEFGLWVEPEMANADSDLLRAHPDWILAAPGRDQPLGRGQYVLDLTREEVVEAVFAQIDALLRDHPIAYLKWDMNRDLTHALSGGRAATHRQTLALYALIDRLRAAHPAVEIESCSSGGGRADFEILRRTDRIWTSDCNDPIERAAIQRGFSIFFPPEIMGAHVGPQANPTTGRRTSLALRAMTALPGHMGIEADLRAFSESDLDRLRKAIALYKEMRGWLHTAKTVRLEHPDSGCVAFALIAERSALISVSQVATPATAGLAPLRLIGLDPFADYAVRRIDLRLVTRAAGERAPPLERGETLTANGAMLAHVGINLPLLRVGQIAVYLATLEDQR